MIPRKENWEAYVRYIAAALDNACHASDAADFRGKRSAKLHLSFISRNTARFESRTKLRRQMISQYQRSLRSQWSLTNSSQVDHRYFSRKPRGRITESLVQSRRRGIGFEVHCGGSSERVHNAEENDVRQLFGIGTRELLSYITTGSVETFPRSELHDQIPLSKKSLSTATLDRCWSSPNCTTLPRAVDCPERHSKQRRSTRFFQRMIQKHVLIRPIQ